MALLAIHGLKKRFFSPDGAQGTEISVPELALERGEALVLDGPSGSGKTTVLHMVAGLLTPDEGEISFDGQLVSALPTAKRDLWRADNLGYIFQRLNLLAELTVLENILLPQCWRSRREQSGLRQEALALLEQVGLGQRADSRPSSLSIGEQQRIAAVRALLYKPRLLLADEPTASLDAENGRRLLELLRTLCERDGVALLLCTHDEAVKARFARKYNVRSGCYE